MLITLVTTFSTAGYHKNIEGNQNLNCCTVDYRSRNTFIIGHCLTTLTLKDESSLQLVEFSLCNILTLQYASIFNKTPKIMR